MGRIKRTEIINTLIQRRNYKTYLEIGIHNGFNFRDVRCAVKVGVDPDPKTPATYHVTSDEFFAGGTHAFDIVFVDGLHHADQVLRDIENSLLLLNPGGVILCHDMLPKTEVMQIVPRQPGAATCWTGDCWKAFVRMRIRADLRMLTIPEEPMGLGVIQPGTQVPLIVPESDLTYANFVRSRNAWMNITPWRAAAAVLL